MIMVVEILYQEFKLLFSEAPVLSDQLSVDLLLELVLSVFIHTGLLVPSGMSD